MKITDKYVFFWKENPFCNFTKCRIKYSLPDSPDNESVYFTSSEQMFMWFKAKQFGDEEIAKKILEAETPEEARKLGREVKGYIEWIWNDERYFYMHKSVMGKFIQNKKLREQLCDPKYDDKQFVEAAYYDKIWGIGFNEEDALVHDESEWGRNLLGKILNETRQWCLEHKNILDEIDNLVTDLELE